MPSSLLFLDHAVFGLTKFAADRFLPPDFVNGTSRFLRGLIQSSSLPPELSGQFADAGGFAIVVIALMVGLLVGITRYHGWDFRVLRRFKATNRTGENLVWAETLTKASRDSYAVVACRDGSRFMGVIDTFSEEAGNYEILLGKASQVQLDGTFLPIEGQGVLLTRENPIVRVELWSPTLGASVDSEGEE